MPSNDGWKTFNTLGDGNCAFHAIFGEYNPVTQQFFCKNADTKRTDIAKLITQKYQSSDQDLIRIINLGLLEIGADDETAEASSCPAIMALKQYLEDQQHERTEEAKEALNVAIQSNKKLQEKINSYLAGNPPTTPLDDADYLGKFLHVFNATPNEFMQGFMSEFNGTSLYEAYTNYTASLNKLSANSENFHELIAKYFETDHEAKKKVLAELENVISTPGKFLPQHFIAAIANVSGTDITFHIKVPDADTDTLNEGVLYKGSSKFDTNSVRIYFNGSNHFERVVELDWKPPSLPPKPEPAEPAPPPLVPDPPPEPPPPLHPVPKPVPVPVSPIPPQSLTSEEIDDLVKKVGDFAKYRGLDGLKICIGFDEYNQKANHVERGKLQGVLAKLLISQLSPKAGWENSPVTELSIPLAEQASTSDPAVVTIGSSTTLPTGIDQALYESAFGKNVCTISKAELQRLADSARIVTNSDIVTPELFLKIQKELIDKIISQETRTLESIIGPTELLNWLQHFEALGYKTQDELAKVLKIPLSLLSSNICHSQELHFFVEQEIPSTGPLKGKALNKLRKANLDQETPCVLLSVPGINLSYGGFFTNISSTDPNDLTLNGDTSAKQLVGNMWKSVLDSAILQNCRNIVMPAIGLGAFVDGLETNKKQIMANIYFKELFELLKDPLYKNKFDNILFNPLQYTEEFKAILEKYNNEITGNGCSIQAVNCDVKMLAVEFAKNHQRCAMLNPSDKDVILGKYDVGEYYRGVDGYDYVGEEDIAATSTAVIGSKGISDVYSNKEKIRSTDSIHKAAAPEPVVPIPDPEPPPPPLPVVPVPPPAPHPAPPNLTGNNIRLYRARNGELAIKFSPDKQGDVSKFLQYGLLKGTTYGESADTLYVGFTSSSAVADGELAFEFNTKQEKEDFITLFLSKSTKDIIATSDARLVLNKKFFSTNSDKGPYKELEFNYDLKALVLKKIFNKLYAQENNPNDSENILTAEYLNFLITENNILLNSTHPIVGISLLHAAVRARNHEVTEYLLSKLSPGDINAKSATQNTPLHSAAFNGDEQLVSKLMDYGADLNVKNDSNETPLQNAADSTKKSADKANYLVHLMVGKLIDRFLEQDLTDKTIEINGQEIVFLLSKNSPLLQQLKEANGNTETASDKPNKTKVTLTIEQFKQFLCDKKYIHQDDQKHITTDGISKSAYITTHSTPEIIGTSEQSYTEWLHKKYGIIRCGERGEKNSNKTTSILYGFKSDEDRQKFLQQFSKYLKSIKPPPNGYDLPSLSYHYRKDIYGNPAVLLADQVEGEPEKPYNKFLYQQYQEEIKKDKLSKVYSAENLEEQIQKLKRQLEDLHAAQNEIKEQDDQGKKAKPVRGGMHDIEGSRLDRFYNLSAETEEGDQLYRAVAGYKISLQAFIALHEDLFSKEQIAALQLARDTLMGSGKDAVSSGLKADSNFVDFLKTYRWNKLHAEWGKPSTEKLEKIDEKIDYAIKEDAQQLLDGCHQRLVIYDKIPQKYIENKKALTGESDHIPKSFREIPKFFPTDGKGDGTTDEIILQTGGMSGHSTMVRIWKELYLPEPTAGKEQQYYRFYRTEYNTGAGCHAANWGDNTCIGTYTTEISGDYFDKNGNKTTSFTTTDQYYKTMKDNILELIKAERRIMMYKPPKVGPNGELASSDPEEQKRWHEQKEKISTYGKIKEHTHFREQYSSKGILQFSGNCTIKSQKQLLEDVVARKLYKDRPDKFTEIDKARIEAQSLVQLHYGWAQGHNKDKILTDIQTKISALEEEIKELEKQKKKISEEHIPAPQPKPPAPVPPPAKPVPVPPPEPIPPPAKPAPVPPPEPIPPPAKPVPAPPPEPIPPPAKPVPVPPPEPIPPPAKPVPAPPPEPIPPPAKPVPAPSPKPPEPTPKKEEIIPITPIIIGEELLSHWQELSSDSFKSPKMRPLTSDDTITFNKDFWEKHFDIKYNTTNLIIQELFSGKLVCSTENIDPKTSILKIHNSITKETEGVLQKDAMFCPRKKGEDGSYKELTNDQQNIFIAFLQGLPINKSTSVDVKEMLTVEVNGFSDSELITLITKLEDLKQKGKPIFVKLELAGNNNSTINKMIADYNTSLIKVYNELLLQNSPTGAPVSKVETGAHLKIAKVAADKPAKNSASKPPGNKR